MEDDCGSRFADVSPVVASRKLPRLVPRNSGADDVLLNHVMTRLVSRRSVETK
jgi:hypothetical protein